MGEVLTKALSTTDSIFVVLLIGLATFTGWILRYVFNKTDEQEKRAIQREERYIEVIDKQAEGLQAVGKAVGELQENYDVLKADVKEIKVAVAVAYNGAGR